MRIFLGKAHLQLSVSISSADLHRHIHWYERLWPLGKNSEIDTSSIVNNNTYYTNAGVSMTHIINGMAGNIESHSTLDVGEATLNITAVLDFENYGFNKMRVINETAMSFTFVRGGDGSVGDEVTLLKRPAANTASLTKRSFDGMKARNFKGVEFPQKRAD